MSNVKLQKTYCFIINLTDSSTYNEIVLLEFLSIYKNKNNVLNRPGLYQKSRLLITVFRRPPGGSIILK